MNRKLALLIVALTIVARPRGATVQARPIAYQFVDTSRVRYCARMMNSTRRLSARLCLVLFGATGRSGP